MELSLESKEVPQLQRREFIKYDKSEIPADVQDLRPDGVVMVLPISLNLDDAKEEFENSGGRIIIPRGGGGFDHYTMEFSQWLSKVHGAYPVSTYEAN